MMCGAVLLEWKVCVKQMLKVCPTKLVDVVEMPLELKSVKGVTGPPATALWL